MALVTAVGDDELGERILELRRPRAGSTRRTSRRDAEPNGVYFAGADGEFVYARRGSAASTLGPRRRGARAARRGAAPCVVSGITQALSESCAAAVDVAVAAAGGHVVYDPNFRRRLTSARRRGPRSERVAPHAALVTPSCPDDTEALLGTTDPGRGRGRLRALGAARGRGHHRARRGLHLDAGDGPLTLPPDAGRGIVDTTGAGDVLAGTAAARLALGDDLVDALQPRHRRAAARSLAGPGGTGWLPAAA